MSFADREHLAATLDLLVYENVMVAWSERPLRGYEIVLHDGEVLNLGHRQAAVWVSGASAVYLALIDQQRIKPRLPKL
ncbi:hypothetical protein J5X84_25185 [Streptosporangiaceae bacterium NEAU-GS5]|nr:hypothetical protein [Streptosporangiaceae bacterium NEAU-GS5]